MHSDPNFPKLHALAPECRPDGGQAVPQCGSAGSGRRDEIEPVGFWQQSGDVRRQRSWQCGMDRPQDPRFVAATAVPGGEQGIVREHAGERPAGR